MIQISIIVAELTHSVLSLSLSAAHRLTITAHETGEFSRLGLTTIGKLSFTFSHSLECKIRSTRLFQVADTVDRVFTYTLLSRTVRNRFCNCKRYSTFRANYQIPLNGYQNYLHNFYRLYSSVTIL